MGYRCHYFNSAVPEFDKMVQDVERRFAVKDYLEFVDDDGYKKQRWNACFAGTVKDGNGIMVAFNISGDYPTSFIDSEAFPERVQFWINEGKSMGLEFEGLQWKLHQSRDTCDWMRVQGKELSPVPGRALMFFLPLGKISSRKEMHMHLFFLRLLYEKHATIDRYIELRERFAKSHPFISRLGTLILAEATCIHAKSYAGTRHYATSDHHFLAKKSWKCVVWTSFGVGSDNMREWYKKTLEGNYGTFDRNFIGPAIQFDPTSPYSTKYLNNIDEENSKRGFESAMALLTEEYKKELQYGS